ncbi:MAG: sugar transferase, partial [Lentisphaerae bacterium]|nr:sugar transferase [Lentisphaerota bacterium]
MTGAFRRRERRPDWKELAMYNAQFIAEHRETASYTHALRGAGWDRVVAAVLLLPAFPVLGFLFLLHKCLIRDGGPFFYRGERIGKDGIRFRMYKIRTLAPDAERRLEGRLHKSDRTLEPPFGSFLRKTRLDELPQLWNILRGDMAFVGPRPERPSVYEAMCKHIPNYHARFRVLPGLTGLSQFLTPHGTPKKIRARVDNILVRKMHNPGWRLLILLWTVYAVARNVLLEFWRLARKMFRLTERPRMRACPVAVREVRTRSEPVERRFFYVIEIHDRIAHVLTEEPLRHGEELDFVLARERRHQRKGVRCHGVVKTPAFQPRETAPGRKLYPCVIEYRPV